MYFRRFFAPKDASLKVSLDEVHVILNEEIESRFKKAEEKLHQELQGIQELKDEVWHVILCYFISNFLY